MKKTIISIVALLTLVIGISFSTSMKANASEVTQNSTTASNTIAVIQQSNTFDEDSNIQPRIGYQWKCNTCGYISNWHAFYNTAAKNAYVHEQTHPGHHTVVYGV